MKKIRKWFRRITLIGLMPFPSFLKRPVYRLFFGYKIASGVRIGLSYIDCQSLTIGAGTKISHGVVFYGCGKVEMGSKVLIGPLNVFRGGASLTFGDFSQLIRLNVINAIPQTDPSFRVVSEFSLGYGSVITAEHKIDFTDRVTIGRCSILGGRNSSLWSHNRAIGGEIRIGDYCYVGSEIRMAPGSEIPDLCIVGLGSVIIASKKFEPYSLIAGNPASVRRPLNAEDDKYLFNRTRADLPVEKYPAPPRAAEGSAMGKT